MDMESSRENLEEFKKKLKDKNIKIFEVSAMTNTGLEDVVDYLADTLETIPVTPLYEEDAFESHVLYKFKKEEPYTIEKEDDVWVINGEEVETFFLTNFISFSSIPYSQTLSSTLYPVAFLIRICFNFSFGTSPIYATILS